MAPALDFVEITDPETGRPIAVACRLDPIGKLYASNEINRIQHEAARAYEADLDAMAGSLRAQSRGPEDITWRSRRQGDNNKAAGRLKRAAKDIATDQIAIIRAVMTGRRVDV